MEEAKAAPQKEEEDSPKRMKMPWQARKEEKEARNGNEVGVLEVGGWDEYHHSCGP